jgi:hypothetical protein
MRSANPRHGRRSARDRLLAAAADCTLLGAALAYGGGDDSHGN